MLLLVAFLALSIGVGLLYDKIGKKQYLIISAAGVFVALAYYFYPRLM